MTDGAAFDAAKASALANLRSLHSPAYSDKSPKGSLDAPIVPLVTWLNAPGSGYVTTSSCSGRIVLYAQREGRWLLSNHRRTSAEEIEAALADYRRKHEEQEQDLIYHP